jgi:hypothetical protein
MGLVIKMAGVDITDTVDELSLELSLTLGQGAGAGGGSSGRATQFSFLARLGPVATAVGAGTTVTVPTLVRMGLVEVWDASGAKVFGGYATKYTDATEKKVVWTKVECNDFWQFMDRIIINEIYDGMTDQFIINDLLTKYAAWIDRSLLPSYALYTFGPIKFRHVSLQQALQKVTDTTGNQMYVTPDYKIHYESPTQAQTAPFSLSDTPDFRSTFNHAVTDYETDDNAAINRVFFFGGNQPTTTDFVQDLSVFVNGSNTVFPLNYRPRKAGDGVIHLTVNGVDVNWGYVLSSGASNTYISQGGTAKALLDSSAKVWRFDPSSPPSLGTTVTCTYRYEIPLTVALTEQRSVAKFGMFLDGYIEDSNVFDSQTAVQRCRILLLEQAYGLTSLKVKCWKAGLQPGMLLPVKNTIKGINDTFIIQEVSASPKGNGFFEYEVTLGAWNWNLTDLLVLTARSATAQDQNDQEDTSILSVVEAFDSLKASCTFTLGLTGTYGQYYARAAALGDGHDAYCGYFSVSS